jgi:D-amino-acid dehydrogenase
VAELIKTDIAIVGAGIIGVAIAFRLAADSREVVVVDPNKPGSGASYGNAGTLAPYACAPVGNPDVLWNLPNLLVNPDSPLAVRMGALPALIPWLSRFVWQSIPVRARRNGCALADLLKDAMPVWRELAEQARLSDLLRYEGCLYFYRGKMPGRSAAQRIRRPTGALDPATACSAVSTSSTMR